MLTSTDRRRTGQLVLEWPRSKPCRPDDPTAALLDAAGDVDGLHVLVISPGGLDVACGLHERGAAAVTLVCSGRCGRPERADIALVPSISSEAMAAFAIGHAARALRPLDSLILRCAPGAGPALTRFIRACLAKHGFTVVRTLMQGDHAVVMAELPLYGQLRRAS